MTRNGAFIIKNYTLIVKEKKVNILLLVDYICKSDKNCPKAKNNKDKN